MTKGCWDIIRSKYVASAVKAEQYPTPALIETAFIGRSNVGKSSLINSLCRRNGLARVSATPGKTQTITGYGFARTNRNNKEQWSGFISKYLSGSDNLALVCQLIDIRHKPMDSDVECYHWLLGCGLKVQVVLTKSDKLSKNAAMAQKALFKREMGLSEDQIMIYSSSQHTMRGELIARIMGTLEEYAQ